MNNKVNLLKQSPLFAMSLSSKELFHSNFWAWLFERNVAYGQIFFPELDEVREVKREEGHRDITIYSGGKVFVVENKIKSIPYAEQLKKYQDDKSIKKQFTSGVITGITEPSFDCSQECPNWRFISYAEIGVRIKEVAEKNEAESFEKSLIIEYCTMIRNLSEILLDYDHQFEKRLVNGTVEDLETIRMDDVLKKLKADEFVKYLNAAVKPIIPNSIGIFELKISSDYSNKNSIVNIRYVQNKDTNKFTVIGIQIQGGQYRKCYQVYGRKCDDDIDLPENWFDSKFQKGDKIIWDNKSTSMRDKYDHYRTDEYSFVYQYWNIEDFAFDKLKEHIKKDMLKAIEIIKCEESL